MGASDSKLLEKSAQMNADSAKARKALFKKMDSDGNGSLDRKEAEKFIELYADTLYDGVEKVVNKSGHSDEAREKMRRVFDAQRQYIKTHPAKFFNHIDRDGNGRLSLEEFEHFLSCAFHNQTYIMHMWLVTGCLEWLYTDGHVDIIWGSLDQCNLHNVQGPEVDAFYEKYREQYEKEKGEPFVRKGEE